MKTLKEKFCDGHYAEFETQEELLMYYEDMCSKENTSWGECMTKDCEIIPFPATPLTVANDIKNAGLKEVSEEAALDTADNTQLVCRIHDETGVKSYLIRDTAFVGMLDRAKTNCTAVQKLYREKSNGENMLRFAQIVNYGLEIMNDKVLYLKRCEKITALNSGASNGYAVLPINELLAVLDDCLYRRFPKHEFRTAFSTHERVVARWDLPGQKDTFLKTYLERLSAMGHPIASEESIMPSLMFTTSDTTNSAATIGVTIKVGPREICVGPAIKVEHRAGATIGVFATACDDVAVKISDQVEKLKSMLDIHLDYPRDTLRNVMKFLGISARQAGVALEYFDTFCASAAGISVTAHDIYWAMNEIIADMAMNGANAYARFQMEEVISRGMNIDWKLHDYYSTEE